MKWTLINTHWNNLPAAVVDVPDVATFKVFVDAFLDRNNMNLLTRS